MTRLACLCGRISVETATTPDFIHACNCTLCSGTGALWAYFDPSQVSVTGTGTSWSRTDKPDPAAVIHFCPTCGSTTHFTLSDSAVARVGNTMTGVNMRLADETSLVGIELRFPDGRNWPGTGAFGYVRPPEIISPPDRK